MSMSMCVQIVVGVADATMAKDTTFGRVLGYHIGRSKIVTSKSLHKIKSGGKSLSRDTPRRLPINADGHISIMAVVDMHTRRMSIAINRNTPIDTGYYLPAAVRPWVWLGGPGVGAVTLTEYTMIAAIPQSSTIGSQARMAVTDKTNAGRRPSGGDPTGPTALAPAQLAIDTSDVKTTTAEHVAAKGMIAPISPLQQAMYPTPSTPEVRALAMTLDSVKPLNLNTKPPDSDTNSGGSNETSRSMFDPSEWTARATEWFKPMQQMFLNDDADTAPTLMELEKRQVVQVL